MKKTLLLAIALCLAGVQAWAKGGAGQPAPKAAEEETVEISFDVKPADFMTDKELIQVYSWFSAEYDAASGLYKTVVPKMDDEVDYSVEYTDWKYPHYPVRGTFIPDRDQTITVDMSNFRKVVFVTNDPERWDFADLSVRREDPTGEYIDGTSVGVTNGQHQLYMQPGEYKMYANVIDSKTDAKYIGGSQQTFLVEDEDREVLYTVDEENYHQVAITMTDRDGNAMPGMWIWVSPSDGVNYTGSLDEEGKTTLMLHDGEYNCTVSQDPSNSTVYYRGEFTVAGQDRTVKAEMGQEWKKLTVKLTGDLIADFIDKEWLTYHNTFRLTGPNVGSSIDIDMKAGEDNTIVSSEAVFLQPKLYEYELTLERGGRRLNKMGPLQVTEDTELVLELSAEEYGQALIEITDSEGNRLENTYVQHIDLYDGYSQRLINYHYNANTDNIYYLPAGNYTIALPHEYTDGVYSERFTVTAGESTRVTLRMEERETAKVDVQVKVPLDVLDMIYDFQLGLMTDTELDLGYYSEVVDFDPQTGVGTASLEVPKGTYTYELWPESLNRTAIIDIDKDTELSFDFTAEPYMHITLTDEAGVPLSTDEHDGEFYLVQDGKEPIHSDSEYGLELIAFLTPGTYNVWGMVYFYENDSYMNVNVQQTVTMGNTTQHVNIAVPTPEPNRFAVEFSVRDKVTTDAMPGTVTLNGITAPLIDGWTAFVNLPAGSYPYTVQADGYETYTGTVEVNENTADEDGEMRLYVYLTRKPFTTGLGTASSADGTFRVYPTAIDDVLHIAPVATAGGEWTVRLVSASGAAVYAGTHDLTTETTLSVASLPAGLYLLRLDNGTDVETYKVMKR